MSSKRKSVENLQSPSRILKSSKKESVEEEKKEISMRRKKSSPLKGLTPSVELETFYDPNEWEDIEKIMKEDPTFIPFWINPEKVPRLKRRQTGYLPYALFDYLFPPPKLSLDNSWLYYDFAESIIDFIVNKKNVNVKVLNLLYSTYKKEQKIFLDAQDKTDIILNLNKDYTERNLPEIYVIKLFWDSFTEIKQKELTSSHSQLLIINNIHQTIEFYDPQYSTNELFNILNEALKKEIYNLRINWLNQNYEWKSLEQTCPNVHFQEFEVLNILPEPFRAEGFCLMWSAFIAELRIQYAEYSANTMKRIQNKLINKMKGDIDFQTNKKINPFAKFIYEYTLYWAKKKKIKRRVSV